MFQAEQRAEYICAEHRVVGLGGDLSDCAQCLLAGVVNGNVQAAELFDDAVDERLDFRLVEYVRLDEDGVRGSVRFELRGKRDAFVRMTSGDDNTRAPLCK